jgi:hypothetical protein
MTNSSSQLGNTVLIDKAELEENSDIVLVPYPEDQSWSVVTNNIGLKHLVQQMVVHECPDSVNSLSLTSLKSSPLRGDEDTFKKAEWNACLGCGAVIPDGLKAWAIFICDLRGTI